MGGRVVWLALALCVAWGGRALADPRLDEVVYSPYVEKHKFEFETRVGQEVGDGALNNAQTVVLEAEYGVSDRLRLALVTTIERAPGEPQRLTGVGVEGIYYLGQIPRIGVDTGLYLEATKGAGGDSDRGEAKLLLAKTAGRFQGLVNLIVERPFSGAPGDVFATYGYAASATWRTVGKLRLGAEALGDFGDDHGFLNHSQGAYVGPQVKWAGKPAFAPFEIEVDAGWLAAVGPDRREAPSQARINLEIEHRF
ncbi:MAG TPA: hypothetical protein VIJ59_10575 [Caulobacteraceae bacterium]